MARLPVARLPVARLYGATTASSTMTCRLTVARSPVARLPVVVAAHAKEFGDYRAILGAMDSTVAVIEKGAGGALFRPQAQARSTLRSLLSCRFGFEIGIRKMDKASSAASMLLQDAR